LSSEDRLKLETARSIREDYLQQDAFHEVDTFTSYSKTHKMMKVILDFYYKAKDALAAGMGINEISALPVREKIARMKFVPEEEVEKYFDEVETGMEREMAAGYGADPGASSGGVDSGGGSDDETSAVGRDKN
ncbi:MAG: hypothetical protein PHG48_05405, partial [Eubacteriales bacterium]|nr:hypothetical protein [Eubacteriales bacterium]